MKTLVILVILLGIVGSSWSQEKEVIVVADEPATFPGGYKAMKVFIDSNLVCPTRALELGIEGKCYLQFVVKINGSIDSVKVIRGVPDCPECDQEALRLIRIMPNWIPGKINGKPVNSTFNMPLTFKIY